MAISLVTLPAFLAPALVNGDESGLDVDGIKCLASVQTMLTGKRVLDVARRDDGEAHDPRFTWSFRLFGGDADGGDVVDFVVLDVA